MEQIDVKIMERDYRLAVNSDDKPQLLQAVSLVDARMRAIREAGRVSGQDRIAVMAALQLAHELLTARSEPAASTIPAAMANTSTVASSEILRRLKRMNSELDAELRRQESLF